MTYKSRAATLGAIETVKALIALSARGLSTGEYAPRARGGSGARDVVHR
jgi:hypothetical protein